MRAIFILTGQTGTCICVLNKARTGCYSKESTDRLLNYIIAKKKKKKPALSILSQRGREGGREEEEMRKEAGLLSTRDLALPVHEGRVSMY